MSSVRGLRPRGLLLVACFALTLAPPPAYAQFMGTRRMAMGGVTLLHGGPGSDVVNVAYRAVPPVTGGRARGLSLPIGLIPVLQDPPTFDTNDSAFGAFHLANLALHPPWNLALVEPSEPTGDVTLSLGRNADARNAWRSAPFRSKSFCT